MRFVLVALLLAGCGSDAPSTRVAPAEAAALLTDRNWLDVWPTDKDDRLHVYRFVPSMGGGVYHDRTVFQGEFELFVFDVGESTIDFTFPHNDTHLNTGYRIERVSGPEPFDLKLILDQSPRGPRVYFGISGTSTDLDTQLAAAIR